MKKSKPSKAQTVAVLSDGEAGVTVNDLCRKYQASTATHYKPNGKYAGMNILALKLLKKLETENARLKTMRADISLEHKIIKEMLEKKHPELIG